MGEMYYIYDKKGSDYLATICEKGKSHELDQIEKIKSLEKK